VHLLRPFLRREYNYLHLDMRRPRGIATVTQIGRVFGPGNAPGSAAVMRGANAQTTRGSVHDRSEPEGTSTNVEGNLGDASRSSVIERIGWGRPRYWRKSTGE
jgi:hypothetical protein